MKSILTRHRQTGFSFGISKHIFIEKRYFYVFYMRIILQCDRQSVGNLSVSRARGLDTDNVLL